MMQARTYVVLAKRVSHISSSTFPGAVQWPNCGTPEECIVRKLHLQVHACHRPSVNSLPLT